MIRRILSISLCVAMLFGMVGCGVLEAPATEEGASPSVSDTPTDTPDTPSTVPDATVPTQQDPTQPDPTQPTDPAEDDGVIDIGYDPLPCTEEELYRQLFDLDNKITVDIQMSHGELAKLQADYEHYRDFGSKSPIYRMADMTITVNDTTYRIREVGVRMKGNTSRTSFYDPNEGGIYKAIHLKIDLQETFDDPDYYGSDAIVWTDDDARQARKDRTFATLEKLEMRWNKCYDSTYLKETYAYEMYRDQGVLAPLTNLCSFDWSGVHMGVYTINEPVDKVFLEKRLPEADLGGDLYKCGWTWKGCSFTDTDSIGIEDEDKGEFYSYDLKTNKKTSQHESLIALIRGLNSGSLDRERFAELVDVENFLSYAAVSWFLGNPDDLRNNYNNFYLYFLKSTGKAIIIPYDYDRCLGVTVEYNPSGHGMTRDDPFTESRYPSGGEAKQEDPLFLYSIVKGGFYVKEYADALTRVSGSALVAPATFKQYFDRAEALYGDDVRPSKTLRNMEGRDLDFDLYRTSPVDAQDNISFDDYIAAKQSVYRTAMGKLDEYLEYHRPIPSGYYIRGDFNGWSDHDEYAMENVDGIMTFRLRFDHDIGFKVYNSPMQDWIGVERLAEDTTVPYTTNDHGNIQLKAGTYLVEYDPETDRITLTQQE